MHCHAGEQAITWRNWHAFVQPSKRIREVFLQKHVSYLRVQSISVDTVSGVTTIWASVAVTAAPSSAAESSGKYSYSLRIIPTVCQADTQEALTIAKSVLQLLQGLLISMESWGCIGRLCLCKIRLQSFYGVRVPLVSLHKLQKEGSRAFQQWQACKP